MVARDNEINNFINKIQKILGKSKRAVNCAGELFKLIINIKFDIDI